MLLNQITSSNLNTALGVSLHADALEESVNPCRLSDYEQNRQGSLALLAW